MSTQINVKENFVCFFLLSFKLKESKKKKTSDKRNKISSRNEEFLICLYQIVLMQHIHTMNEEREKKN